MADELKRHPLAIAWDEWLASPEGRAAANPDSLPRNFTAEPFLKNRLHRAFDAGVAARAFPEGDRKLLEAIAEEMPKWIYLAAENGEYDSALIRRYLDPLKELIERLGGTQ